MANLMGVNAPQVWVEEHDSTSDISHRVRAPGVKVVNVLVVAVSVTAQGSKGCPDSSGDYGIQIVRVEDGMRTTRRLPPSLRGLTRNALRA